MMSVEQACGQISNIYRLGKKVTGRDKKTRAKQISMMSK